MKVTLRLAACIIVALTLMVRCATAQEFAIRAKVPCVGPSCLTQEWSMGTVVSIGKDTKGRDVFLTAAHVIKGASDIWLGLFSRTDKPGREREWIAGRVLAAEYNSGIDIAVLVSEAPTFEVASWQVATKQFLPPATPLLIRGYAKGQHFREIKGAVTRTQGFQLIHTGRPRDGMSGGAILNAYNGELCGIINGFAVRSFGTGVAGIHRALRAAGVVLVGRKAVPKPQLGNPRPLVQPVEPTEPKAGTLGKIHGRLDKLRDAVAAIGVARDTSSVGKGIFSYAASRLGLTATVLGIGGPAGLALGVGVPFLIRALRKRRNRKKRERGSTTTQLPNGWQVTSTAELNATPPAPSPSPAVSTAVESEAAAAGPSEPDPAMFENIVNQLNQAADRPADQPTGPVVQTDGTVAEADRHHRKPQVDESLALKLFREAVELARKGDSKIASLGGPLIGQAIFDYVAKRYAIEKQIL